MQHNIASIITRLSRYSGHAVALIVALTLISGVFSTSADATGRKSRSGRWTQILAPSLPLLVNTISLTGEL